VVHADGSVEELAPEAPWNPHNQPLYRHDPPVLVRPGDSLETHCRYDNPGDEPISFGGRASDEMCYAFNLVYPIAALPTRISEAPLRLCDCPATSDCDP
jgi:hypothetical protein